MILDLGYLPDRFVGFSLAPDGKSFATSISTQTADIWLLEGFSKQLGFFDWLFRK
jgi:hypothetical protein